MRRDDDTHPYSELLDDDRYALRVGRRVPEGDVNLAYIHTPLLDSDENVSIVNTSASFSNTVPHERRKSLVSPDHTGKLSYVEMDGGIETLREVYPKDVFPSKEVAITKHFKDNIHSSSQALFYKFDIKYHFDTKKGIPGKVIRYTGDQIRLTDENGQPVHDTVKHDIYVMAMEKNPHIYWIRIYLNETSAKESLYKVRYNHIDEVVSNHYIQATHNELELYSNSKNQLEVDGRVKQLVQNGKLRVLNDQFSYREVKQSDLGKYNENDEVYSIQEDPVHDGYNIRIPHKSESDPRDHNIFNYKIEASFKNHDGRNIKISTGYISDWVTHVEALLPMERDEYTKEWKTLGIPNNNTKMNVKEMIHASLPVGVSTIPRDAVYTVTDARGNILYTDRNLPSNPNVKTEIEAYMRDSAVARSTQGSPKKWIGASFPNVYLRSKPIENHPITVYAERQKAAWSFEFYVNGTGRRNGSTWSASANGYDIYGGGVISYNPDGTLSVSCYPERLSSDLVPSDVTNFTWGRPTVTKGNGVTISLANDGETIMVDAPRPPIQSLGRSVVLYPPPVHKKDGVVRVADLYGSNGVVERLNIPSNIPINEVLLRIERGANGANKEYRVNYRFKVTHKGVLKYPVDQQSDQLGVNRIRLQTLYDKFKAINFRVHYTVNAGGQTITGEVSHMDYVGRPGSIFHHNAREYCHPFVVTSMKAKGLTGNESYTPISYSVTVFDSEGEVIIPQNGRGPIQIISVADPTERYGNTEIACWTHHEELEATPVFAISIEEDRKIELEGPKVESERMMVDEWYPRIRSGRFSKTIQLPYYEPEERTPAIYEAYPSLKSYAPKDIEDIETITLHYEVSEYTNQEFYEGETVLIDDERPLILNEHTIQTVNAPIVLHSEKHISYLEVEVFRNNRSRKARIKDVDAKAGIIYLVDRVREEDRIKVRYAYRERHFSYRGFRHRNEFYHLDLNPSPGHTHTVASDGFLSFIPNNKDMTNYTIREANSNELLVKPVSIYLRPVRITDKRGRLISGTTSNYSVFHTTDEHWFNDKDYLYDPSMFRLGKILVEANSKRREDTIMLDTRTRGGGLDEEISRKIISEIDRTALDNWDIGYFDGQAYQENGVIIIRLPRTILKSRRNVEGFTEKEVEAAIKKHKAYGVLPIIEYYDPEKLEKTELNEEQLPENITRFEA